MIKRIKYFILLGLIFTFFGSYYGFSQKSYKELVYPPLHDIQVPKVERVETANGMVLFLLEDHELPLIELSAMIGVGSVYEPADKTGLASITGSVMRTGGSSSMSGEKMDEVLEAIAASVETDIGMTSGSASLSVLKEHFDQALALLADVLMNPVFPEEKIKLAIVEHSSRIARRNDEPFGIANREFSKIIYGGDSPYARQEEYATLDAIQREDLLHFHQQYFHPNNIMVAITGDFDTKDIIQKIEKAFSAWKKGDFQRQPLPEVNYQYNSSIHLIQKEDINQAHIWLGHLGGLMNNPDYHALVVMNRVFGEGFTSRLFKVVRSRMGLTYNVRGRFGCNYEYPGLFFTTCQTKLETMSAALEAMKNEITKMTQELPTDEELAQAKEQYLNSFVFQFDSKAKIVNRLMTYEFWGYPPDFLQKTKENIEKVTKEEVLRVAQKYLHPEQLRIMVLGNSAKFDPPLSKYGEVKAIDITIPEPKK